MANKTEYLNLTLPLGSDRPDIQTLNQNFKMIDAACERERNERSQEAERLAGELHTETGRAVSRENAIETAQQKESERAVAAEENLRISITEESERAAAAEEALQEAVTAETVRALAAERANAEAVSTETVRALEAEKQNSDAVNTETIRASARENALQNTIEANKPIWDDKYTKAEIENKFSAFDPAPVFTQAPVRATIESGEKLSVLFGKIKKWLADLKSVAFSGSYADLTNKPTIPAAVAVKGNAESSYRTGNVNLTAENVGALPLSGGMMKESSSIKFRNTQNTPSQLPEQLTLGGGYIDCRNEDGIYSFITEIAPGKINLHNDDGPDGVDVSWAGINVWGYDDSRCYISTGNMEIKNVETYGTDVINYKGDGLHGVATRLNLVSTPIDNAGSTRLRGIKINSYYTYASLCPYDSPTDLGNSTDRWRNIYATNGAIQTSDRTKKADIESLEEDKSKAFIMGLTPVSYKMTEGTSGRTHYGLIAQDVEELMSELGMDSKDFAGFIKSPKVIRKETDENGQKLKKPIEEVVEGEFDYSLRYDEFIAPLIRVIQSQQNKIDRLTSELSYQRKELDEIKAGLSELKHLNI